MMKKPMIRMTAILLLCAAAWLAACSPQAPAAPIATPTASPAPSEASSMPTPSPVPSEPVLIWSDEFDKDGLPDGTLWGYDKGGGGWGNNELQYYTENRPENAQVKDGKLVITAVKEEFGGMGYTSARLITRDTKPIQYGRIALSAKLPKGRGTWPAIWLLPVSSKYGDWPKSGEIDMMEHVGFDQGVVHYTLHSGKYNWPKGNQITSQITVSDCSEAFHEYAIEWRPESIDYFLDGKKVFETKFDLEKDGYDGGYAWPFDQPFYLILNVAVGGNWGGQQGIDDSVFPQSMEIDYVRVYDLGNRLEGDTTPPTQVSGMRLVNKGAMGFTLEWRCATDNFAVQKYEILLDGKPSKTAYVPYFNFPRMAAGETHTYQIISVDKAGNKTESEVVTLKAE